MRPQTVFLTSLSLFAYQRALSQDAPFISPDSVCSYPSSFSGPCFTVHGVMSGANGSPSYRISIRGTKRILGVECPIPPDLERLIGLDDKKVYADFVVRPLAPDRPGHMRPVCVASSSHIVTRPAYFLHPQPH